MDSLKLKNDWIIPSADLSLRAIRSSGPGGQNVNKVSTKVELRFELSRTSCMNRFQKLRFQDAFASSVNQQGQVVITCDETRSQATNLQTARERLRQMILSIAVPPRQRISTRRTRGSERRRLNQKKRRSELKKQRSRAGEE